MSNSFFMNYFYWLIGLGAFFTLLERWTPREERPLLRNGIGVDLLHVLMNSFAFPYLLSQVLPHQFPSLHLGWASGLGWTTQFLVMTLYCDLAQYGIHNLLHRVSWLWRLHKIHHQAPALDWMVNWHFHYAEVLVYRTLLYVPAGMFGFAGDVMFWHGVMGTAMGHFTHSNLRWKFGLFRYVFNSPAMHLWHHAKSPINKNFGMVFSLWDWLFGTAYFPPRDPEALGIAGEETPPRTWFQQLTSPFKAT